jgi:hypothetical protein
MNIVYHAPPGSTDDGGVQAQKFAAATRDAINAAIDQRLISHFQSGGLLNQ